MSKQIAPSAFILLPSGDEVFPSRLIHRDGTIMWKHALEAKGRAFVPACLAHEAHIIKTAARIEELNAWVSQNLDIWNCLVPKFWYDPTHEHAPFANGYACEIKHVSKASPDVVQILQQHVQDHETLKLAGNGNMYFSRC
jgi:hypothetical protein